MQKIKSQTNIAKNKYYLIIAFLKKIAISKFKKYIFCYDIVIILTIIHRFVSYSQKNIANFIL